MKKFTLIMSGLILLSSMIYAQSQRMILAEECTSSTCWPCGQQNPAFDAILQANADVITSIKYHVWWPSPGNDPMYLANPVDNAARTNYYGVNGVPTAIVDGGYYQGQPAGVSQSLINSLSAVPSPFEIQVQQELSPDEDSIYLTTLIHATDNVSGNLIAHVVVVEKHISFASPPGTNGEKDFYMVMKKLLPDKNGTQMPSSMETGDYVILQNSWELANVYDNNELAAVVFVQDNNSKDVHQAANSSDAALTPVYATDAEILEVHNTTSTNCSGSVTPTVTIRNNGGDDLTSMTINYHVNDGDDMTYEWSGNLAFLQTEEIALSEISFDVADTNTLVITGVNPNGVSDDFESNNTFNFQILRAPSLTGNAIVFLTLDDHPEETTWEIKNSAGEVVQSGGPYETSGQKIEPITVSENDCYEFVIYDAGGNGTEYYAVVYGNNQVAFEGSNFGALERNEFALGTVGVELISAFSDVSIYPNPAHDRLSVDFYLPDQGNVEVAVTDLVGKSVVNKNIGVMNAGPASIQLNTSKLVPGIYIVRMSVDGESYSKKISIR